MELAPRLARLMFGSLSRVAPSLTSKYAETLFLTPERYEPSPRELKLLATGRPFTIQYQGRKVAAWSWGDGGPAVFLVHGWSGRGGQMGAFVDPLLGAGFSAILFDAPGHGMSDGKTSSIAQFAGALRALADHAGGAHAVIGHSMGGSATALALRLGLSVKRAVLIGSPSGVNNYSVEFAKYFGLTRNVQALIQQRVERRFGLKFSDLDIPANAKTFAAPPLLLLHDTDDQAVSIQESKIIAAAWPGSRLIETHGLGHMKILRDPEVIREAVDFIS